MNSNTKISEAITEPLAGLTVLDLTRVRAGPTCVRQLADWGANVVKVEAPVDHFASADFSSRHDADFQNLHRNKRSLSLNLKTSAGIAVLKKLVESADILVENYRPAVKDRLGIDYKTLSEINPRLIYASISGFGQSGPYEERPGVDQIAQGMSGLMSVTGEPGRGPMRVGIAIADVTTGLFAALGILVALFERTKSGRGQWVQANLLQSQIFMLDFQAARFTIKGEVAEQAGNNHPTGVPAGTFQSSDGYLNIAPTPPMWNRFCKTMGLERLIEDPLYSTLASRQKNRDSLNEIIQGLVGQHDRASMIEKLNSGGIPCGPVYTIGEAMEDPQVKHLGVTQSVESKMLGHLQLLGQPIKLSRASNALKQAAPEVGEHTTDILSEYGYSREQIESLRVANVI